MADAEEQKKEGEDVSNDLPFAKTTMGLHAQAPAELQPGVTLLEKFKIIKLLGVGGMGSVYKVEHLFMNQEYALKCLNKAQRNDINWRRFENEAKAANMLDHPNLLRVYEFGLLPGSRPYFLMELVNGVTLADEIKKLGRMPMKRAVKIFVQVAFAINYAHDHKIIHRDLKSSNIMLETKGPNEPETVKIVDFGIAKLTGVDEFNQQTLTKTGEIFGSPLYMSPEQCSGTGVDNRSDLYSLGCLFYEAMTGAPPFIGESALATMMKHQNEAPLSLKEASMGIGFPASLERIVAKLLEKDPSQRYQKASHLAADLIELERTLAGEQKPEELENTGTFKSGKNKVAAKSNIDVTQNLLIVGALAGLIGAGVGGGICYSIVNGQMKEMKAYYEAREEKDPLSGKETSAAAATKTDEKAKETYPAGSFSRIVGAERILKFPPETCLGTIIDETGFINEAEGLKRFPKERKLSLLVRNTSFDQPEILNGLSPDDFVIMNFASSEGFPAEGFKYIAKLTGLRALILKHSHFNDSALTCLDKMVNLRYVNFSDTRIHGSSLAKSPILKNLNALDVSDTTGLMPLCQELGNLHHLLELQMQHCQLDDMSMKDVSQCKSLRVLSVATNKDITDGGASYLKDLPALNWLDLSATSVSPNCLESILTMKSLKKLELGELNWTDAQKNTFEKTLKAKLPGVKLFWHDQETTDLAKNLPDFKWEGGNLK